MRRRRPPRPRRYAPGRLRCRPLLPSVRSEGCALAPLAVDCGPPTRQALLARAGGGVVPAGVGKVAADSDGATAPGASDFAASGVYCSWNLMSRSCGGISHTTDTPTTTMQAVAIPPSQALFRGQPRGQNESLLRSGRAAVAATRAGVVGYGSRAARAANAARVRGRSGRRRQRWSCYPLRRGILLPMNLRKLRQRRAPRAQSRLGIRRRSHRIPQLMFKRLCFHTPPLISASRRFMCLRMA